MSRGGEIGLGLLGGLGVLLCLPINLIGWLCVLHILLGALISSAEHICMCRRVPLGTGCRVPVAGPHKRRLCAPPSTARTYGVRSRESCLLSQHAYF